MGYMMVKYEYRAGRYAFGRLDDLKGKVEWMTRRRHLPKNPKPESLVMGNHYGKLPTEQEVARFKKQQRGQVPADLLETES